MFDQTGNTEKPVVVCLHSSGANGGQWRALVDAIGDRFDVLTPDLIGYGRSRFEPGDDLSVELEVEAIAELIRDNGGRAHLVGHSYGGAIATHVALWYPERVASLAVYEPVLFSLLYEDDRESPAFDEVERVALSIMGQVDCAHGRWRAAREFINYWAGGDAWCAMEYHQHARFARLMPKVAAEFCALIAVGTPARALQGLRMPARILSGDRTRRSTRRTAELFAEFTPGTRLTSLQGLGHMAPITDADIVNPLIVDHLVGEAGEAVAA